MTSDKSSAWIEKFEVAKTCRVLHSKRVDFEFLQCILAKLACPELYFDIQLCQVWDYVCLKLWAVTSFDVVLICINAY